MPQYINKPFVCGSSGAGGTIESARNCLIPSCKTNLLLASAYQVAIYNCALPHTGGLYKVQPCGASKLHGCIYLT